jgi:transitional endoplasmic reticulum ATPase
MQPTFWLKIAKAFKETVGHAFTLHGQGINDYADGEIDLVPWLEQVLVKAGFDFVIKYDLAQGITLPLDDQKTKLADLLNGAGGNGTLPPQLQKFGQQQQSQAGGNDIQFPRDPQAAFNLINDALKLSERTNPDTEQPYKVALVFPYANDLFGASAAGYIPPQERVLLEFALTWARNPVWRGSGSAPLIFFITPSLKGINPLLAEAVYPVEVQAPDYEVRLSFIKDRLDANPDANLADELTPERFAAITAGLQKVHIMDVIVQARINATEITPELVSNRKREIMQSQYSGILETEEATGSLDDVAGLDYLVGYLRDEVIQPMKDGDAGSVPMGILLAGPPGTGKTYMATKVAAEAGVNFVNFRMANILGGIVGESEKNLEKALAGIRSLTPCIVFVDEIDQAFRRSEGFDGSSVNRNIFGRLLNFMADTANRGKVVWLAATNRPDLLDAAMLRSGRFDAIVAVLPPETGADRQSMFQIMAKKNRVKLADNVDLTAAADATDGYTGADIERVVLKAASVARKNDHEAITGDDLDHALKAVRIVQKDRQRMVSGALAAVNDLDLLPPRYRELAEAQDAEDKQEAAAPQGGRQARDLLLED